MCHFLIFTQLAMKISVVSPTVRPEGLPMVAKCLARQDFSEWEWIIVAPKRLELDIASELIGEDYRFCPEPPKREGDYYRLSGAFNTGFAKAKGELVVVITDWIWFPPDTLSRLWSHYIHNPKACVTTIGHQYDRVENNRPEIMMWQDPRARTDLGTFYEVAPSEMELCLGSIPRQGLIDSGGVDEDYDKGSAVGEKEMFWRMDKLGYKFFIDQSIEYKALHHPRLNEEWDEAYKISSTLYSKHMGELSAGKRTLNVDYLNNYL